MVEIGKGYSRYERETIINWSEDDDYLEIYTASPHIYNKIIAIAESFGIDRVRYQGNAAIFRLPLKSVGFKTKRAGKATPPHLQKGVQPSWLKKGETK